ncbi:hypothetical protein [Amycolatopsis sp. cmx-4-61]|uniref:hypothetical protein n=1 Tax=Amycolatopsis sp. cmx-4-61 TaxID=2790937 RepID=UPI003979BF8C
MFPRRATTTAVVAAALLASAPAATATTGYRTCSVVRTIAWTGWAAGPDGRYHAVTVRRPYSFSVVFPVSDAGVLSSSSRASASRR